MTLITIVETTLSLMVMMTLLMEIEREKVPLSPPMSLTICTMKLEARIFPTQRNLVAQIVIVGLTGNLALLLCLQMTFILYTRGLSMIARDRVVWMAIFVAVCLCTRYRAHLIFWMNKVLLYTDLDVVYCMSYPLPHLIGHITARYMHNNAHTHTHTYVHKFQF